MTSSDDLVRRFTSSDKSSCALTSSVTSSDYIVIRVMADEMCPAAGAEAALPFEVATADQGDPRSPVKRFLTPLGLNQHRDTMKHLGFDTPDDFGDMTPGDAADMRAALLEHEVPLGHVLKIMRSATQTTPEVAQQLQPACGEGSASVVETTSVSSWERALAGPRPPASAEQSALIQTSIGQAKDRREIEHQDKVCHTPATRRRPHRRRRHRSFLAPSTLKPAYPLHI